MPLIRNGEVVADDWTWLSDEAAIPANGDVIVPFARLAELAADADLRSGRLGIVLPNTIDPLELQSHLKQIALIALDFPAFTDGRAYSQARTLRQDLDFAGELRATGDVLPDQAAFMTRCGFDAFDIGEHVPLATWQRALGTMTHAYQRNYLAAE
jgi:uncharacterized protein (DUF934 family)